MSAITLECPVSIQRYPKITMAHGGGGRLTQDLISKLFYNAFENSFLLQEHDGAVLDKIKGRPVITTDSYVVNPLFFPGGDIGKLSVFGTVNDLAMCGAQAKSLTLGLILEEGLMINELWQLVCSIAEAAKKAGVVIVTGDTKVVEQGHGDGIYINTTGLGEIKDDISISPGNISPGDAIIISGDIGRHGIAVMAAREGFEFESTIDSDLALLNIIVEQLLESSLEIHCLRDLTRGGLATVLCELSESAKVEMEILEENIVVNDSVRGACEILGLDPLYIANEGCFVLFLPEAQSQQAIEVMKASGHRYAGKIGTVISENDNTAYLQNPYGSKRILDRLSGEQLPRIC